MWTRLDRPRWPSKGPCEDPEGRGSSQVPPGNAVRRSLSAAVRAGRTVIPRDGEFLLSPLRERGAQALLMRRKEAVPCPAARGTGRAHACGVLPRCGRRTGRVGLLGSPLRPSEESSEAPEGRGSSRLPPKTEVGRSPSVERPRPRLSLCGNGRCPLGRRLPPGRIFKNEASWPRWSGEKKPFPARAALCNGAHLREWPGWRRGAKVGTQKIGPLLCRDMRQSHDLSLGE
ncbi:hypothetical protein NDU88_009471 [Pleurodeles waltl]|uniref:Uncharacterized protein n=1 Tax=Pleurodeles waltl TaxID=8319 RepID=A0AAV7RZT4_PLEWA|nr:hypothetical protein NDU88_009471 [Pleurodeles waltl]